MSGWFKWKQAFTDLLVCGGAASFAWFWFAEVLGFAGCAGIVFAAFAFAQLVRFVRAQLATLEWARMQEAGLPEKQPTVVLPRGGYRDAALVDEIPSPDAMRDEAEIARRRAFAQRSLGIVGAGAALATLVPGLAFGAWALPIILGAIGLLLAIFLVIMRQMRRQQARVADDELARQRVAINPPKARVGVDFGVPADEREEEDADEQRARRLRP